jgi:hypothetical protein
MREGADQLSHKPIIANQAVADFLKTQGRDRRPTRETGDTYALLNRKRHVPGKPGRKPEQLGFPLLESLMEHTNPKNRWAVKMLLVAASLKVKRVKRHPGWVLQRTYNLKNRVIEII